MSKKRNYDVRIKFCTDGKVTLRANQSMDSNILRYSIEWKASKNSEAFKNLYTPQSPCPLTHVLNGY